jgi:hypothetical protein
LGWQWIEEEPCDHGSLDPKLDTDSWDECSAISLVSRVDSERRDDEL